MARNNPDFVPLTKVCGHCLLYPAEAAKKNAVPSGLCRECAGSLSVSGNDRARLWKRQLRLFLNYKKRSKVLALYSGGTDSTLALYLAKKELKLDVTALMFDFGWSRPAIEGNAEKFISKYRIPLIKVKIDLKAVFLSAYADLNKVEDRVIADYPWCQLCGVGDQSFLWWGMEKAAALLGIEKVVVGNNYAYFNASGRVLSARAFKSAGFIREHAASLRPSSVLDFRPDVMEINLPLACGYDKPGKMRLLRKIGFSLPEHYFRTPGSECHLAFQLPCARKLFDPSIFEPKASAYREFISGYLSREEWLEELVKSNNFSPGDPEKAMRYLRDSLARNTCGEAVSIAFNGIISGRMPRSRRKIFRDEFTRRLKERVLCWHYGRGSYTTALREALRAIGSDERNGAYYEILGECYYKLGQYKEAVNALKKACEFAPVKKALRFLLMKCYSRAGRQALCDEEIRKIKETDGTVCPRG